MAPAPPVTPVAAPTSAELDTLRKYSEYMSKNIEQFPAFNRLIRQSSNYMSNFGFDTGSASDKLEEFSNQLKQSGVDFTQLGAVSDGLAKKMGLIASVVFDIKESFSGFSSESVNTFSSQVGDMIKVINKLVEAKDFVGLSKFGEMFNITDKIDAQSVGTVSKKIEDAIKGIARQGDNLTKIRDVYLQAAAASGEYGDIVAASGLNFEKINLLLSNQLGILGNTIEATNLTKEQAESYYLSLSKIPGMIDSVFDVNQATGGTKVMSGFVAAIQIARGAGRDFASVTSDLSTAFENYGLKGRDALKYVSDMTAIQEKFKLRIEDVRQSINSTSGAFKNFVDVGEAANRMQQSAVNIMSTYVQGFVNTKMTGQGAVDIITSMTGKMKTLTLEQKAFLSAQTGGPGGIRGGLQIEKMLREGKVDEVLEKVRKTMVKQFGSIVTLDDATRSEAAASQFTRQRALLTKGPFGQLARSDEEAARMLEVFKQMEKGVIKPAQEFKGRFLEENIIKGETVQRMGSYTDIARMRASLDSMNLKLTVPAGESTGRMFGTKAPIEFDEEGNPVTSEAYLRTQTALNQAQIAASERAGKSASFSVANITEKTPTVQSNLNVEVASSLMALKEATSSLATNTLPALITEVAETVYQGAGKRLKNFAATVTSSVTNAAASLRGGTQSRANPAEPAPMQVNVSVNGVCIECGMQTDHSEHSSSVTPAATAPKSKKK